ncbi:unnamed protein product [Effrenium voratum]|nr:unnamed protein product [Effrenium voratum]
MRADVRPAIPWRFKALALEQLGEAAGNLAKGSFAACEESCRRVLALNHGWRPSGPILSPSFDADGPQVAADGEPLALEALRLRLSARLQLGAWERAEADALRLRSRGRWAQLAQLAQAAALLGRRKRPKRKALASCDKGGPWVRLAAHRAEKLRGRLEAESGQVPDLRDLYFEDPAAAASASPADAELEESAWHVATALPPLPDYVCKDLEVQVLPSGRGVVATTDIPQGTLLMAANAACFQGPAAFPAPCVSGAAASKGSAPEDLVKVFADCTAPMQKALAAACGPGAGASPSTSLRRQLGTLSDGEELPEVPSNVLQRLASDEDEVFSSFSPSSEKLFGILKTNGFSCGSQAWGLWPIISFVNHSCWPSAHYVITEAESSDSPIRGGVMLLRAAKDLSQGEEVTFEYFGAQHAMRDLRSRRQVTENHGAQGFSCRCARCSLEEQLKESDPFFQLSTDVTEEELIARLPEAPDARSCALGAAFAAPALRNSSLLRAEALERAAPASMEHLEALEALANGDQLLHWLRVRYGAFEPDELRRIHQAAKQSLFPASFIRRVPPK